MYEEMVNGRKLTEIINTEHENVKYLPGYKLPENVVAIPDVVEAAKDADIITFVLPHQFMTNTCKPLIGKIKPTAFGVSLCKVSRCLLKKINKVAWINYTKNDNKNALYFSLSLNNSSCSLKIRNNLHFQIQYYIKKGTS